MVTKNKYFIWIELRTLDEFADNDTRIIFVTAHADGRQAIEEPFSNWSYSAAECIMFRKRLSRTILLLAKKWEIPNAEMKVNPEWLLLT